MAALQQTVFCFKQTRKILKRGPEETGLVYWINFKKVRGRYDNCNSTSQTSQIIQ